METNDTEFVKIMQRIKEREAFIEKENALLDRETESALAQNDLSASVTPLANRDNKQRQSTHSIYPTEELETMKRLSLESPPKISLDSPSASNDVAVGNTRSAAEDKRSATRRARFAALAADLDNFEYDVKPLPSKETIKPRSPRLSSGDTSPKVLFTPTASYYPPASVSIRTASSLHRIDEGNPVSVPNDDMIAYVDESFDNENEERKDITATITKSPKPLHSNELKREASEKCLRFAVPECETVEMNSSSEKHALCCEASTDDDDTLEQSGNEDMICTGKTSDAETADRSENEEYGIHKFFKRKSPVSSEHHDKKCNDGYRDSQGDYKDTLYSSGDSETQSTTIVTNHVNKNTHAKQMAKQLDEKIRNEKLKARIAPKLSLTLSKFEPQHFQQRKGLRSAEIDTRSANVKKLRCRWEVSSTTGTPLHPDQEEDELLQAAVQMAKSMKQERMRPQSYCETHSSLSSNDFRSISGSCSTPRFRSTQNIHQEQSSSVSEEPASEMNMEINKLNTSGKSNSEPNKLIDDAFQFINTTPDKNTSLMSAILSTPEIQSNISFPSVTAEKYDTTKVKPPLAHSVSFYRKKEKETRSAGETVIFGQFTPSPLKNGTPLNRALSKYTTNDRANFEVERARLEKAINVQNEQIVQASRALSFCHSTQEFRGSREEVDAQRALLIATERRRALIYVLDGLIQKHASSGITYPLDGPRGNVTFSDISVKLMRDFVNGHINYHDDQLLFYFIVLIRHGETVHHTTLTTSDEGICSGRLEFPHYIQFRSLPHDFTCIFEIFALRTRRELLKHEAKYHIKGSNSLKKSQKAMFAPGLVSPGGPSAVIDPSFQRVGHLSLNIGSVNKSKFQLSETLYPLDGCVEMKVRCYAEDCGTVGYKGFLSLFQPVENIASWTRFWCVLWDGQLRFWRYPEDESTKVPVVSIDLRTCACDQIRPIPVERCPYPNSMQIDVWLPGNNPQKPDRIRILMAADRKDEMQAWLTAMNISLRNLTLWSCRS